MSAFETEEYYKMFGKRLTDRMYERHVTQSQLSRDLKIPKGTVSNWMNGKRLPRAAAMDALCHRLQVTRAELFGDTPAVSSNPAPQPSSTAEPDDTSEVASFMAKVVCSALEAGGYSHLQPLFLAALPASEKNVRVVTRILQGLEEGAEEETEPAPEQKFRGGES